MNDELTQRLQKALPPFDGNVLHFLPAIASRSQLVHVVAIAVRVLHRRHGNTDILVLEDWLEHDDWISKECDCSWAELEVWARTPETLAASCSDDWRVHTLVYTVDFTTCLRYWVDTDDDVRHGFDVCGDIQSLHEIEAALIAEGLDKPVITNAREYFIDRMA